MIETSVASETPIPIVAMASEIDSAPQDLPSSTSIDAEAPLEAATSLVAAAAPAPRKSWAVPKPAPQGGGSDPTGPKKKSLLEIMEEEKQREQETQLAQRQQLEERLLQEEEEALLRAMTASMATNEPSVEEVIDDDLKLALMLSMQDRPESAAMPQVAAAAVASLPGNDFLTEAEMEEIERALQEADAVEHAKTDAESMRLALELQDEEDGKIRAQKRAPQGNVRTMNRADFQREKGGETLYGLRYATDQEDDGMDGSDDMEENGGTEAGYRINSTKQSPWSRADRATIRGPNQELRTKHDPKLQGQANAYRLELRADDATGERAHVGNKAYNAFHRSMQKKTVKGVAAHGHGRATADADKTRDGALDGRVRLHIARAVNSGLIEEFHGCVKEGKEALVFHADKGSHSEGFDVAVKVFKRISEFRNRVQYVEGDSRYRDGQDFKHAGARQQVEMWAEKEHRNLVRAYRAKVPVPKPLWYKDNVLLMRFLGEGGWPSPQLRELDMKKGSKKWTALYEQTMSAMQMLYCDARLVHGDLSEYNILVCPEYFLRRFDDSDDHVDEAKGDEGTIDEKPAAVQESEDSNVATVAKKTPGDDEVGKLPSEAAASRGQKPTASDAVKTEDLYVETTGGSLQIVLIDFGQAVDLRHPNADELLRRDVTRIKEFFDKMGITTVGIDEAMAYIENKGATLLRD